MGPTRLDRRGKFLNIYITTMVAGAPFPDLAVIIGATAYPCYTPPMTKLTPIESEFATTEEAEAYEAWLSSEIEASLADPRPSIPHDQVMAELRAIIAAKKARQA